MKNEMAKIKLRRSHFTSDGKLYKELEVEVEGKALKECEKMIDKYTK